MTAETFEKDLQVDNTDDPRGIRKFTFKRVWYDGYLNLKYTITVAGLAPFHMVRNENGEWKFENPIAVPIMSLHMESKFARAIEENESLSPSPSA